MLIDFHCHLVSINAIYCTAQPQKLQENNECLLYCQGLLPQYWTAQRQEFLLQNLKKPFLQLGEVGLDKRYEKQVSLQVQEENLLTLLATASKLDKIVTLHSVKTTERTIKILNQVQSKPWKVIWHGFTGSLETAKFLYKMGIFISIGPRYKLENLKELAKVHPNFVLETDYEGTDQTQYNTLLQSHYQNCAKQLGWDVEDLKEHCYGQAKTLTN